MTITAMSVVGMIVLIGMVGLSGFPEPELLKMLGQTEAPPEDVTRGE